MATVLIVDDKGINREPMAAILNQAGYTAVTACNGRDALQVARQHHPDLILLDLAMPEMDGIAFLEAMHRDPGLAGTRVLVLSALEDRPTVVKAAKLGIRGYLLKSQFSLQQMLDRIEQELSDDPAVNSNRDTDKAGGSSGEASDASREEAGKTVTVQRSTGGPDATDDAVAALKSIKPIVSRSEIDDHVNTFGELKALSPSVARVLQLTANDNCSLDQVSRAIKQDHAIALKIIKLANSAIYTNGDPVESVQKAVSRIGLKQIRQAVMNISIIDSFSNTKLEEHLSTAHFWEHSIACALLAAEIARTLNMKDQEIDGISTMALLHDVGRMVYAAELPDRYLEVLEAAEQLALPLEQVETRMLLVNHADVMDRLLRAWKFPKELIDPIALHHLSVGNIRRMSPHHVQPASILSLANGLAKAMMLGTSGNTTLQPTEPYLQALRLSDGSMPDFETRIADQTTDLKLAMLSRSSQGAWPDFAHQVREKLPDEFRPAFAGAGGRFDPVRLWCQALERAEEQDPLAPPNMIIAHLTHVRERAEVTRQVMEIEAQHDQQFPTVIISPKANIEFEPKAMKERQFEPLPLPLTLARLIAAVRRLSDSRAEANKAA